MVLVAVGEDQAEDIFALLDEIADVRQDQIDAGQMLLGRKRNAAIDDEPLAAPVVAEAVDREIHPDLADAAERREDELVVRHRFSLAARDAPAAAQTEREDVACRYFLDAAAAKFEHQTAGLIEADEAAGLFAAAVAHA